MCQFKIDSYIILQLKISVVQGRLVNWACNYPTVLCDWNMIFRMFATARLRSPAIILH